MKKFLAVIITAALIFSLSACGGEGAGNNSENEIPDICEYAEGSYEVAFAADDESLKEDYRSSETWNEIKSFASENDLTYKYYDDGNCETDDDRYNVLKEACNAGAKVVEVSDEIYKDAVKEAAAEFEHVKFIILSENEIAFDDYDVLDNVAAITFNEYEAGYLAGYAAIIEGYSNFGLVEEANGNELVYRKFAYGIAQGINDGAAGMGAFVRMYYLLEDEEPVVSSKRVKDALESWFAEGYECMFICDTEMSQFMYDITESGNGALIGTRADDLTKHPRVITSVGKDFGTAAEAALNRIYENKWDEIGGKVTVLGVAEDALYLPTDDWRFENFTIEQYEAICDSLSDGKVAIDTSVPEDMTKAGLEHLDIS